MLASGCPLHPTIEFLIETPNSLKGILLNSTCFKLRTTSRSASLWFERQRCIDLRESFFRGWLTMNSCSNFVIHIRNGGQLWKKSFLNSMVVTILSPTIGSHKYRCWHHLSRELFRASPQPSDSLGGPRRCGNTRRNLSRRN